MICNIFLVLTPDCLLTSSDSDPELNSSPRLRVLNKFLLSPVLYSQSQQEHVECHTASWCAFVCIRESFHAVSFFQIPNPGGRGSCMLTHYHRGDIGCPGYVCILLKTYDIQCFIQNRIEKTNKNIFKLKL